MRLDVSPSQAPETGVGERRRLTALDCLRGVAAVFVLLNHVENTIGKDKFFGVRLCQALWEGQAGVQLFFVLSGFVIWRAHGRDVGMPSRLMHFFRQRAIRLLPPLWATLACLAPVYFWRFPEYFALDRLPAALLLLPEPQEVWLAVEWTLRHEALFYVLFAFVIAVPRLGWPVMTVWALASGLGLHLNYPWSFYFDSNHILFFIGIVLARWRSLERIRGDGLVLAGLLSWAAVWSYAVTVGVSGNEKVWLYGLSFALLIRGTATVGDFGASSAIGLLRYLGAASYSIYLVHYPVVSFVTSVTAKRAFWQEHVWLAFMAIAMVAVAAGLAFYHLVERPLIRFFSAANSGTKK
jgi:exopolysaccharide production protein ExoZ